MVPNGPQPLVVITSDKLRTSVDVCLADPLKIHLNIRRMAQVECSVMTRAALLDC